LKVSSCTSQVTVRYAETDQMGVVYHSHYLVWMEVARTDLCKALGFPYSEMEADGVLLAVTEASCRYLKAARYGEDIQVTTTVKDANRRFIEFSYKMTCGDRKVATGHTRHIFLNKEFRPTRLPDRYAAMFDVE
jgi:acyl-CoA thioester hydrolase